jgi:hypothetical protein
MLRVTGRKAPDATATTISLDRIEAPIALTTTVVAAGLGRCLTVDDASRDDGATVGLAACGRERVRSWTLDNDGQLANRETGKCLDIANASTADGAKIQQWSCNGGANQKWVYETQQRLINPGSGKCVRVAGDGRRLVLGPCDDAVAARLTLGIPAKATVPEAPLAVTGVAGTAAVKVSWQAPPSDGGSDIVKYKVVSAPASKGCVTSTGWSTYTCTVPGLKTGTPYTFTVTAQNGVGVGTASAPSPAIVPR